MSNTNKKSTTPIILAVALLIAVALMIFMLVQRNALSQQNEKLTSDLAESQATVQAVSEEKTVLLGQLTTANNDLKEAQTSLAESLAKAAELDAQITTLNEEKAGLELDLTAAIAVQEELQGYIATTTDLLVATQENLATTSDLLTATAAERDQLVIANAELAEKLAAAEAVVSNATADLKAAREKRLESLNLLKSHNERTVAELNVQLAKTSLTKTDREKLTAKIADLEVYIADLDAQIAEVTAQLNPAE